jgi:glycine betaine/proline transport system substrate-binding protein
MPLQRVSNKGESMKNTSGRLLLAGTMIAGLAACGSSATKTVTTAAAGAATTTAAAPAAAKAGEITIAVNPWGGSAANAYIAKYVLETKLNTPVKLVELDENASWIGLDKGDIDANLEIWPSGHGADVKTYIDEKKTVVNLGLLGPTGKIAWYVNAAALSANAGFSTWEGFKDPAASKKLGTAETGDLGRFLMGDPSYVSYDEQIIANLKLPLKYTVAGSEATLITAIDKAEADKQPLLLQFWSPHWEHAKVKLTEVKLPAVTPECLASADAKDGKYACDYAPDPLFKAANAKLATKNAKAFAFLSKMKLTTDQQNAVAGEAGGDAAAMTAPAKKWVDANPDIVKAWLA